MKRVIGISIFLLAIFALFIACKDPVNGDSGDDIYTVTFDKNHSDTTGFAEANPKTKKVTSPATTVDALPTAPTRASHTFAGWNTQANGNGTEFTATTTVTKNITVYAQWTAVTPGSFTVTFDKNHTDTTGFTEASPATKTVTPPATTVDALPTEPTRAGYNFVKWNTLANGEGTEFTGSTTVTESITVYAEWEQVYTITIEKTGDVTGDSVTVSPTSAKAGETITINYTVAGGYVNNRLVFSGTETAIGEVDEAGTGTREYIVDAEDADQDGTITITATFTHTNKSLDTIAFQNNTEQKTYGDPAFTITVSNSGQGSGTISYSSSHNDIATVNASSGQVTILKVGTATITATKPADATYEGTTANYALHIAALQLTIGAPTGSTTKVYDGTTTATGITAGSLTNKVGSDDVTATVASTAYNSANVADANKITVVYSISGADAGNYIKPVDSEITSGVSITKAAGAAITTAPTEADKAHSHITVSAVTAPGNGQTVEYGISTASTTEPSEWQDGLTFTGLDGETDYYVFARAKANANYNAGAAAVSAKITTAKESEEGEALTGTVTVYQIRHNSARINTVAAPTNGQTVEYAVSTESTAPDSGWQDGRDFTGLTAATAYYAYARAKDNGDYLAGATISGTFTTKAVLTPYDNTAPIVVDFEEDITLNTAKSSGGSSPTLTRVADPDNSGEQSLQIASADWNQAAVVPIHLDYALQNYHSFTFRFMQKSGTSTNAISVYVSSVTSSFANGGFGNGWTSTNTKFPQFLLGEIASYTTTAKTDQWVDYEIIIPNLNNPDSGNANEVTNFNTIKNLQGDIYLAIGINQNGNLTNLFDDLTFNLKPYLDSSITPTTATFIKDDPIDIEVAMTLNGNTLTTITSEDGELEEGEDKDYTMEDGVVTLLTSYLTEQDEGSLTLTFDFNNGDDPVIVITIMDSRPATVLSYDFTTDPGAIWSFAPSQSNMTVSWVSGGGLQIANGSSGYHNNLVVLPFNIGDDTLASYSSITIKVRGVSTGDITNKDMGIEVRKSGSPLPAFGTYGNNIRLGTGRVIEGSTNVWKTTTITISKTTDLSHLTGSIEIGFYIHLNNGLSYQIESITLNK